jgi:hypothetical protein
VISFVRRVLLEAIGRRPALPGAAGGARSDSDRRFDDARRRLKATIPPPAD